MDVQLAHQIRSAERHDSTMPLQSGDSTLATSTEARDDAVVASANIVRRQFTRPGSAACIV